MSKMTEELLKQIMGLSRNKCEQDLEDAIYQLIQDAFEKMRIEIAKLMLIIPERDNLKKEIGYEKQVNASLIDELTIANAEIKRLKKSIKS